MSQVPDDLREIRQDTATAFLTGISGDVSCVPGQTELAISPPADWSVAPAPYGETAHF
jgi:hypothetical protein